MADIESALDFVCTTTLQECLVILLRFGSIYVLSVFSVIINLLMIMIKECAEANSMCLSELVLITYHICTVSELVFHSLL